MVAPFRISKPAQLREESGDAQFREYLSRLLKMIPAEVVGVYMIGSGFIPTSERVASAVWAAICLILVVVVRTYGTADPGSGQSSQPVPVGVAAIAFVIWIYSQGGPFQQFGIYVPYVGSLAVLLWTFVIPIFYKGN